MYDDPANRPGDVDTNRLLVYLKERQKENLALLHRITTEKEILNEAIRRLSSGESSGLVLARLKDKGVM